MICSPTRILGIIVTFIIIIIIIVVIIINFIISLILLLFYHYCSYLLWLLLVLFSLRLDIIIVIYFYNYYHYPCHYQHHDFTNKMKLNFYFWKKYHLKNGKIKNLNPFLGLRKNPVYIAVICWLIERVVLIPIWAWQIHYNPL